VASADTEFGSFSDDGPWNLSIDDLARKPDLLRIRAELRALLPLLIRKRRLPPGARVGSTVRHLGGALGMWYITERRQGGSTRTAGISRRLRVAAEHLGPTLHQARADCGFGRRNIPS
jgi:hypothetical protein